MSGLIMDLSNEVDFTNNNITPLWKRRSDNDKKSKPRPLSYQIDGVLTTDFPVDDRCQFTLTQPAEKISSTPSNTAVLKHTLNKPTKKTRVVRSISIGYSNGRFSLSKFTKSEDDKNSNPTSPAKSPTSATKNGNGLSVWHDKNIRRPLKRLSNQFTLISQKDQIIFGDTPSPSLSPKSVSPQNSPHQLSHQSQDVRGSPISPSSSPSHSSTSSIPSLSSSLSITSDPPTPRTPSPSERSDGVLLHRQSSGSSQGSEVKHPSSPVILSTHSPSSQKMGTQQIIPRALASDTYFSKPSQNRQERIGLGGVLDTGKRGFRPRSMFETGSSFSTSKDDELEGEENPGSLTRGLRSKSYRRAVVSGVDMDVPSSDLKANRLSQPALKGVSEDKEIQASPSPTKSKNAERKKGLPSQRTFDSEEEKVLYQNYQEKALHNDSDEDAESKEPKPDKGIVVQFKPIRTSWSQLSVAIFEVISSEHSYFHSLEILIRLLKNSNELSETINKTDHHHLFSNIADVCESSKKFFKELEDRHQQNIVIDDISDIVIRHAETNFDPYVTYCSNEVYQQRTLQKLLNKSPSFKELLTRIEAHTDCRNLPMISFLILPMQRVTRLPLLMDTICQKTPKESPHYEACKKALHVVSKLVRKCNEGARTMERTEMMYTINSQLEFKIKPFPLVSSSRWMVKRSELTAFVEENGIFSKRMSRQQVYFFLFNDVLIVTKKKSEESYTVIDYALRDQIRVESCHPEELSLSPVRATTGMLTSRQNVGSHLFKIRFRSNHSGDDVTMILGAELLNERARWISALGQNNSDYTNADRTNAMQVEVTRTYTARQPDELSLQVADVVLVSQTVDGWYEGERLRDGERGWFLSECAEHITCQATIEKNMQRMDRLQGLETNV
ncbi:Rho guanine nucleotide exchange factor 26 SH3 domain-containing guanine exchange factor [Triplophysa tibetana]|uniref:Rho guanine nucleotide exchange factor 26 SH3 domain-containing guanine exchange factor n=1 Tax=Triplophysa tibetana TaxID=1572043 RepID=A0A5A9NZP9_9TELE|nr:Rho guanine nucleotide exchange factor 26 SH3 domain-containing guanine exchange factor [Triplophysa tibetana]